ncbi:DUF4232 domain-containing protein [Dactylosporangium sp. CA-092794]|uniref:DUF4232 domain-containing protein n=1 Tax=Dactylosporangium sp. CA-092794 TaxID=3239929 RepID=UPI003D8A9252
MFALPVAALSIALLTACGGGAEQGSAAAPGTTGAPAAPPSAGAGGPSGGATGGATSGGKAAECETADIKPELILQPDRTSGQTSMAMLQLTNTASHACTLSGWAKVTLTDAADDPVPVPTENVSQPGGPVGVELAPGTTASAGIKWTGCDKADPACGVGNGLSVSLPDAKTAVPATLTGFPPPEKVAITIKSLQVGTIQPSRQGVVAW